MGIRRNSTSFYRPPLLFVGNDIEVAMIASAEVASDPSSTTGRRLLNMNTPKSSVLDSIAAGATSRSTEKGVITITHL